MARGLMGASLMSGVGQGIAQAAGTSMQMFLLQQRERMEDLRMQRMEQAAAARDARLFTQQKEMQVNSQGFQREMQQETRRQHVEDMESQRAYQRGVTQEERGQRIVEREQDRQFSEEQRRLDRDERSKEHGDTLSLQREKMNADERQHAEQMSVARRHYGPKVKDLVVDSSGNYLVLMDDGHTRAMIDNAGQPVKGQPKFSKQDEILAHGMQEEMKDLRRELADPMTDSKRAAEIRSTLREKESTYRTVLGRGNEGASSSQMARIVDPFAGSSPMMTAGKAPATSNPSPADESRAVRQPEADRKREETRRGAMEAMAAPGNAPPPMPPPPPARPQPQARMTYQRPTGMQQPGDVTGEESPRPAPPATPPVVANVPREFQRATAPQGSTDALLAEKRAELAERVAAIRPQPEQPAAQPKPKRRLSLIESSNSMQSSPTPKSERSGLIEQSHAANAPQSKAGGSQTIKYADWYDTLQPEDRQKLGGIIEEYESGKRSRDEFITGVMALNDDATSGFRIAEAILRNIGKKAS